MLCEGMIWGRGCISLLRRLNIVVSEPRLDVVRNHDFSSKLLLFHLSATSRLSRHCEKFQVPKWNCQRTEDFARNWPPTAGNGAAASLSLSRRRELEGGGPSVMANQWPNLTGWGNAIGTQTWLRITPYHLLWFRVAETRGHFYFPSLGAKFGIRNQPSTVGLIAQRGAAHSVRCTKGLDAPERGSLELNLKQMTSAAGFQRFEDVASWIWISFFLLWFLLVDVKEKHDSNTGGFYVCFLDVIGNDVIFWSPREIMNSCGLKREKLRNPATVLAP